MKDGFGVSRQSLRNIDLLHEAPAEHPLTALCEKLGMTRQRDSDDLMGSA
jgi:hypothetical protein